MRLWYHVHEIDAILSFQLSVVSKRCDWEVVRTGRVEGWRGGRWKDGGVEGGGVDRWKVG